MAGGQPLPKPGMVVFSDALLGSVVQCSVTTSSWLLNGSQLVA